MVVEWLFTSSGDQTTYKAHYIMSKSINRPPPVGFYQVLFTSHAAGDIVAGENGGYEKWIRYKTTSI